jgi:hypothetical protein
MWVTGEIRAGVLVLGYGFGVGAAGWGFVPVSRRLPGGLSGVGLSVDVPPVPSSLPILGHRWSASTSFVLAALRALHVGSCAAVTDAATIEEGTTTPLALQVGDTHGWSSLGSEAIETNRNREDQSPVRATTAFKRLIDLRGVSVTEVGFGPAQVVVTVRLRSRRLACPLCGFTTKARYDLRSVASSWRHLDLGRWRLQIRADLARLACPTHGVLTQGVPLARAGSRFTRDFEDLVGWLATTMDKTALRRLVRIDWDTTGRIIGRVMVDGLDPRRLDNLFVIGADEVSWRRGHPYVTLVSSSTTGRFVWGKEGKDTATLDCSSSTSSASSVRRLSRRSRWTWGPRSTSQPGNPLTPPTRSSAATRSTSWPWDRGPGQGPPPGLAGATPPTRQGRGPPVQRRPLGLAEEPRRPHRPAVRHLAQAQTQGRPAVAGVWIGGPTRRVRG